MSRGLQKNIKQIYLRYLDYPKQISLISKNSMIILARANRRRQESIRHEIRIIMPKVQRAKSMGI